MTCKPLVPRRTARGGRPSFLLPPRVRMPTAPCPAPARTTLTGPCWMSATSLLVQPAACARTLAGPTTALHVGRRASTATAQVPRCPGAPLSAGLPQDMPWEKGAREEKQQSRKQLLQLRLRRLSRGPRCVQRTCMSRVQITLCASEPHLRQSSRDGRAILGSGYAGGGCSSVLLGELPASDQWWRNKLPAAACVRPRRIAQQCGSPYRPHSADGGGRTTSPRMPTPCQFAQPSLKGVTLECCHSKASLKSVIQECRPQSQQSRSELSLALSLRGVAPMCRRLKGVTQKRRSQYLRQRRLRVSLTRAAQKCRSQGSLKNVSLRSGMRDCRSEA